MVGGWRSDRRAFDHRCLGDASQLLAIDGEPRQNGFVRVGVGWWSIVSDYQCADQSAPANVLRLSPDSRFSYRFDGRAVDTVAKAWGALPPRVRLLVEGKALQAPTYDAAWRIGTALQAGGKQVQVVALPKVGDSVDLAGISIPASLQGVPAYAALAAGERVHAIKDLAEVGALLSLRDSGPLAADVMIGSDALRVGVRAALDALAAQVGAAGTDAGAAFATWRDTDMGGLEARRQRVGQRGGRCRPSDAGGRPGGSGQGCRTVRRTVAQLCAGPQPAGQRSRNAQTGR